MSVDLKVSHLGITRRIGVPADSPNFDAIIATVKHRFSLPEDKLYAFTYLDSDGDSILISAKEDLLEIWPAKTGADLDTFPPLRLNLVEQGRPALAKSLGGDTSSTPPASETPVTPAEHATATFTASEASTTAPPASADDPPEMPLPETPTAPNLQSDILTLLNTIGSTLSQSAEVQQAIQRVTGQAHGMQAEFQTYLTTLQGLQATGAGALISNFIAGFMSNAAARAAAANTARSADPPTPAPSRAPSGRPSTASTPGQGREHAAPAGFATGCFAPSSFAPVHPRPMPQRGLFGTNNQGTERPAFSFGSRPFGNSQGPADTRSGGREFRIQ